MVPNNSKSDLPLAKVAKGFVNFVIFAAYMISGISSTIDHIKKLIDVCHRDKIRHDFEKRL